MREDEMAPGGIRPPRRSVLAGGAAAFAGLFARLSPVAAAPAGGESALLPGINLAGADFGSLPGKHGTEYLYPRPENFDYYSGLGFRLVRLPFKWERLQPEPMSPFAEGEQALLREAVGHGLSRGMTVAIDPHNYAKRRLSSDGWAKEHLVGSEAVPAAALHDFWRRLAALFKGDAKVLFGLMNEPAGLDAEPWLAITNGTIAAIRETGADNLILVPGVAYTGAHSWRHAGNTVMGQAVDPLRRLAFEVHQYFDADSSGTSAEAVSGTIGAERIETFQEWARAHGHRAFLGEFGAGDDPASLNALRDVCTEMAANQDVWLGWAAWAGGPRWPDDNMHTLEPHAKTGEERAQTTALKAYATAADATAWALPGAAIDLDLARGLAFGVASPGDVLDCRRAGEAYAASRSGALRHFAPDTPRITDLGLIIEEERENLFQASQDLADGAWKRIGGVETTAGLPPLGADGAVTLREEQGDGWCALMQRVRLASPGDVAASIHIHHLSRRWLTIRGDHPSSAHAAFDVEGGIPGQASGGAAGHEGFAWGWQRASLAWRAEAEPCEILFSLQDRQGNAGSFGRTGAGMHVCAPMLEAGRFATSYHPGRRASDAVSLRGPLADMLASPERTILLELRDIPEAAGPCPILGSGSLSLLERTESGALRCDMGRGGELGKRPPDAWRGRIKIAVALSAERGTVTIAATGHGTVSLNETLPALGPWQLGSRGNGALNGRVTRLAAFARALAPEQLAALVA